MQPTKITRLERAGPGLLWVSGVLPGDRVFTDALFSSSRRIRTGTCALSGRGLALGDRVYQARAWPVKLLAVEIEARLGRSKVWRAK